MVAPGRAVSVSAKKVRIQRVVRDQQQGLAASATHPRERLHLPQHPVPAPAEVLGASRGGEARRAQDPELMRLSLPGEHLVHGQQHLVVFHLRSQAPQLLQR